MLIKNISMVVGTVIKVGDVELHVLDIGTRSVRIGVEAPKEQRIQIDTYIRRDIGRGPLPTHYKRDKKSPRGADEL